MPEDTLRSLNPEQLEGLAKSIAAQIHYGRRQEDQKKVVSFWLTGAIGLISIISLIFTLGVNWGRINAFETWQHQADVDIRALQSQLATNQTQTNVVQSKLENIGATLAEIKGVIYQRPSR